MLVDLQPIIGINNDDRATHVSSFLHVRYSTSHEEYGSFVMLLWWWCGLRNKPITLTSMYDALLFLRSRLVDSKRNKKAHLTRSTAIPTQSTHDR